MANKYARRRYIINWRFQMRYILFTVVPIVLLGLFAVIIGFRVAYEMANTQRQQLMVMISSLEGSLKDIEHFLSDKSVLDKAVNSIKNLKSFSQDLITLNMLQMKRLTNMVMFAVFIVVMGAGFLGVFFSHRIAGPIFRLQRHIHEMSEKLVTSPIKIRSRDEFQELAASLEQLRKSLLAASYKRQDSIMRINQILERIEEKLDKGAATYKQDLETLKSEVTELKNIC